MIKRKNETSQLIRGLNSYKKLKSLGQRIVKVYYLSSTLKKEDVII